MNASSGESPDAVAGESAFWLPRLDRAGQVLLLALAFAVVLACFTSWTLLVFMREDMAIAAAIVGALSVARTYVLVLGRDAWNLRTTWDWIVGRFVSSAVYAAAMMLAAHLATQLTIVVAFEVLREPSLRAYVYHVNDFLLYLTFLTGLVGCWFWPWHAFSDPEIGRAHV